MIQDQQQMKIIQEVLLNNNSPLLVHRLNNNFQEIEFHSALHLNFDMHDVENPDFENNICEKDEGSSVQAVTTSGFVR